MDLAGLRLRLRKAPRGALAALALVLAVEAGLERLDLVLTRTENLDWRRARRAASSQATRADVLCFGTSMTQEGVFPAVIERRTGLKAYNLAVCAGRIGFNYYLLRRALARGARPSAVLLDVHPALVTVPYKPDEACWGEVLGLGDALDLAWTTRDPMFFTVAALHKAFPSVRNRFQIRKGVVDALNERFASMWLWNNQHLRNVRVNRGALLGPRDPRYDGSIKEVYRQIFLMKRWRPDPTEALYLRRFLDLASAHGITVYWLIMPLTPALQQARQAAGADEVYDRFVRSFEGTRNLVVVDGRRAAFGHSVFLDACHLDSQGAFAFTEGLAEVFRRRRGGDSRAFWHDLPAYRDHPIDVPMEDTSQSGLAILNPPALRR